MQPLNIKHKLLLLALLPVISCEVPSKESNASSNNQLNLKINESEIGIDSNRVSKGQLLFVATYSGVQLTKENSELVGSNLSIRNTSRTESITLKYVDFYDDHGALHENYLDGEVSISPMGSQIFHIHQFDSKGGAGSNFLVEWESKVPVSPPYIENMSFRMSGAQSFAFSSPAVVLRDRKLK